MRIAIVLEKLSGLRGGAERLVVDLAGELGRRGHEVTIVTFEPHDGPAGYELAGAELVNLFPVAAARALHAATSVRQWRQAPKPAPGGHGGGRIDAAEHSFSTRGNRWPLTHLKWQVTHGWFARQLRRWLRRHPVDVVVGFLPPAISAVAVAGSALSSGRPRLVASTHNVPSEDFGDSPRWDQNPVARQRNLWALEQVDVVTVLQPEFVDQLPGSARPRAVVLPNPVQRLSPATGSAREPLIIGVGRLTDVKRYDILIEAFSLVAADLPDWRVEIYGDGPERERLAALLDERGLSDRIELAGTTDAINEVYDRARLFVHPARYEGFGLVVAEAIMHGVPVVGSRTCSGVNRLIDDGRTGALVDEGRDAAVAFAVAMRRLIGDPPTEEERSAAAAALGDRLSPSRYYEQWERVLAGELTPGDSSWPDRPI